MLRLEVRTTWNMDLPSDPFELLITGHGKSINKRSGFYTIKVHVGTCAIVEVFTLAKNLVEQGFTKSHHGLRSNKTEFLRKHFAKSRF